MIHRLSLILFVLAQVSNCIAQSFEEKNFRLYTTIDGLSNNEIWSIAQDSYGYIWVATAKGLNRFDGNTFQQFYSDSSRNSLPQDRISKLRWFDKELLAVITSVGLHIINTRTLASHNLIIPPDSLKQINQVNTVCDALRDKEGNTFIITGTGFYHFNKKDELVFRYDYFNSKYLEAAGWVEFGRGIAMVPGNRLLLTTVKGLYVYNIFQKVLSSAGSEDDLFFQAMSKRDVSFSFMHIDDNSFSLQMDDGNELSYYDLSHKTKQIIKAPFITQDKFNVYSKFLRLNDSVFMINNGKTGGFYLGHYNHQTGEYILQPKLYCKNYFCFSMFVDKNNYLWIGSRKGLYREKRQAMSIEKITVPPSMNPLNNDINIVTLTLANNKLFAGTLGDGLLIFGRDSLNAIRKLDFREYGQGKGILLRPFAINNVYRVFVINVDTVLVGIDGALIALNTRNLQSQKIALPDLKDGEPVLSLFKDSRNGIYVSRKMQNEIYYKAATEKEFKIVRDPLLRIRYSWYFTEDPQGNIWCSGYGISRFNYLLQKFDKLMDSFPAIKIPGRSATNPVFDKEGKMYFGIWENGLMIYDTAKKKFEQLTRTDGLPDNNFRAVYLHGNKVWIGTESGLASYDLATKKISSFGITDDMPAGPFTASSFIYDTSHKQLYGAFNNTIVRFNPDQLIKNNSPPDFFIESIIIPGDKTIYHPPGKIDLYYKYNDLVLNLATINFEDAYEQQFAYRFIKKGNESWHETGLQRSLVFSSLSPGKHRLQVKVFINNNSWPSQIKEIEIFIQPPFWKTWWFFTLVVLLLVTGVYIFYKNRIGEIRRKARIDRQMAEFEMKALHAQMNPHFIFNCLNSIREMILNNENQQASHYLSKFAHLIRITLNQSVRSFISLKDTIDYLNRYLEMEKIRTSNFSYHIHADKSIQQEDIFLPPMLIQPFIENAIWHGTPQKIKTLQIDIRFVNKDKELLCIVEDNGIGIKASYENKKDQTADHDSIGIENVKHRIEVLNEKYDLNSRITIEDKSDMSWYDEPGTIVTLYLAMKNNLK